MEQQKDVVSLQHADYIAASNTRDLWHDVLGGTERLREMHDAYLPKFPLESSDDYKARWQSATMTNATAKTLEAFCGLVCQNPIALGDDVPKEIEKLTENIDNKGNHLDVVARDAFQRSFAGYSVILVDSPAAKVSDAGTERALGLRPYFVVYDACDVINWDYRVNEVSRKTELSLIVFKETKSAKKGMFLREKEVYYRVFWLDDTGKVLWQLWKEQKNENKETICVEVTEPAIMTSQVSIPAAIIGKLGDKPPLRDLAYKNLEHAQMYSDYRSIVHKTCVPLPYTTGVSGEEFGNLVQLGGTMFNLPQDATIGFAEVSGASIDKTKECIDDIKKDMAMLGLAMLAAQPTQGEITATETMLDSIQETSALQVRANQLKDAIELAFGFMARYLNLGEDKGGSITLGANWNQMVLAESELTLLNNMVADGNYPLEYLLLRLQEAGKLPEDKTAEDALAAIDEEMKKVKPLTSVKMLEGVGGQMNEDIEQDGNIQQI
jgi:hypothetical protein